MNKLIARLIDTGMPRAVALCMYRKFRAESRLDDFERYVEEVEAETRVGTV